MIDTACDLDSPQFVTMISRLTQEYLNNPLDNSALIEMRKLRERVAQFWIVAEQTRLKSLYYGEPGRAHQILLNSNFQNEALLPNEEKNYSKLSEIIKSSLHDPGVIKYLLAAILYRPADKMGSEILQITIPDWYIAHFAPYLLRTRNFFVEKEDFKVYQNYMDKVVQFFHESAHGFKNNNTTTGNSINPDYASLFTRYVNFIPLYFGYSDLKDINVRRAELAEASLIHSGCQTNYITPKSPDDHKKIRLGILSAHYNPQTETYATLPVFEHLDRSKYEIILFGADLKGHKLEHYCHSRADRLVQLPADIKCQIQAIREADLDILFIGSNITAVSNSVSLLATCRLAPVQATSICSPVTTGTRNIDYYIAGDLTVSAENDQEHYTEKLVTIPGSGLCFSYATENETPTFHPSREWMGISEESVIFVSGANFFKLIPEVRETWARIIAEVPDSLLVLYPFNPYWSRSYQAGLLIKSMQELFTQYGINQERLVLLKPFPQRSDIKELLKISDVYLDAYPYGGATSLIDPLETGLPPVVMHGKYLRFMQASALLHEIGVPGLVTRDEVSYRELATTLGKNGELRKKYHNVIIEKMKSNPPFLDSKRYSEQFSLVFEKLVKDAPVK